jgi:glycosyltransferase involved in cell wall biosynthesis
MTQASNAKNFPLIEDYAPTTMGNAGSRKNKRTLKRTDAPQTPLVSIITIVRNRRDLLQRTILSVAAQSYSNIEYIVVDGASTDGTLDTIKSFEQKIDYWISEPDLGASDGFNKGVCLAQGDYIFWLSSDDWIDTDFIEKAVKALLRSNADFVFGNMLICNRDGGKYLCNAEPDYARLLFSGNPRFNFPSMVVKREWFSRIGLLDVKDNFSSDYDWLLRMHLSGGQGICERKLIVYKSGGGFTDDHPVRTALQAIRILRKYNLPVSRAIILRSYMLASLKAKTLSKELLPRWVVRGIKGGLHRLQQRQGKQSYR